MDRDWRLENSSGESPAEEFTSLSVTKSRFDGQQKVSPGRHRLRVISERTSDRLGLRQAQNKPWFSLMWTRPGQQSLDFW